MRIASLKQLRAAKKRLAQGYNNTDHNYLRNQAVLITERMQILQMPQNVVGYPNYDTGPWDSYYAKMRTLEEKLSLTSTI